MKRICLLSPKKHSMFLMPLDWSCERIIFLSVSTGDPKEKS